MATTTTNLLVLGLHGKLGNQVIFRRLGDKTVMSNVHDYSNAVWSPAQKLNRLNGSVSGTTVEVPVATGFQ